MNREQQKLARNSASLYYSLNLLRQLRDMGLLTEAECEKIAKLSSKHYKIPLYHL